MTSRNTQLFFISLLIIANISCSTSSIDAKLINRTLYETETHEILFVEYYELQDESLGFIKIKIPDIGELTLPHVLSASGAMYTDQAAFMWWSKGREGTLYRIDNNGEWEILFGYCQVLEN